MKRNNLTLVFLFLTIVLSACGGSATSTPNTSQELPGVLNIPFKLRGGESAFLMPGEVHLEFSQVLEDSRCPLDVVCEWGGEARLLFLVQLGDGEAQRIELGTQPGNDVVRLDGLDFHLISVEPYPEKAGRQIAFGDYAASLLVNPSP